MTKNYIPTINISSLIKNNFETLSALKTIKEIEKACVNIGFFQVTGHDLNLKEINKNLFLQSKCNSKKPFLISSDGIFLTISPKILLR